MANLTFEEKARAALLQQRAEAMYIPQAEVKARAITPAAAFPFWASKQLGIDIYDGSGTVNWPALAGRIAFAIRKMGEAGDNAVKDTWLQTGLAADVDGAYKAKIPLMGYDFVNTAWGVRGQHTIAEIQGWDNEPDDTKWANYIILNDPNIYVIIRALTIGDGWVRDANYLKTASFRKIYAIWLDVERWWLDYNDYLTNGSAAKRIDQGGVWMEFITHNVLDRLTRLQNRGFLPHLPLGIYTGKWVIDSYSPPLDTLTTRWEAWVAGWYYNPTGGLTTPEAIKSTDLAAIPDTWRPRMFGKDPARLIQWAGDYKKIAEIATATGPTALDWNVYWHPTQTLNDFLGVIDTPAPVAGFTVSPFTGSAPLMVTFTDTSTGNPTAWAWDFGDGGSDTVKNPVHAYLNPGVYTVTLTATNPGGSNTSTQSNVISVSAPAVVKPTALFSLSPLSGPAPLTVTFTDFSGNNPTSWAWDFGDGVKGTVKNPTHIYSASGVYTVTLTVTNAGGSDTTTGTVTVTGLPGDVDAKLDAIQAGVNKILDRLSRSGAELTK